MISPVQVHGAQPRHLNEPRRAAASKREPLAAAHSPPAKPVILDNGGAFVLEVYPGRLVRFETVPRIGAHLDVKA